MVSHFKGQGSSIVKCYTLLEIICTIALYLELYALIFQLKKLTGLSNSLLSLKQKCFDRLRDLPLIISMSMFQGPTAEDIDSNRQAAL